ncbi:Inner membrane protein YciS [Dickeya solani]|nr:Inner membrane protein YciS [Dickeya solani]
MKYMLIFFLVLAVFIVSITLGAHNDQVITFNYLLAQGNTGCRRCWRRCLPLVLPSAG